MDPNLQLLAAYAGDYEKELIKKLHNSLRLEEEGIMLLTGVKYKRTLHKMIKGKGVKPYTGKHVPGNNLYFEPRVLEVAKSQYDIEIEPEKYRETFMAAQRGKGENADNQTIPFAEHMWNEVLEEQSTEINLETVYNGVGKAAFAAFNPASAYAVGDLVTFTQAGSTELRYWRCIAATTAGQSPDTHAAKWDWAGARALTVGYGKIIADEITAGNVTPVATGAVTAANGYDKAIQMWRSLPEPIQMGRSGQPLLYTSLTDYQFIMDQYEDKVSKNFETIDGITYLAKTEKRFGLKSVSWLSGRRRMIATVKNNLVAGTDQLSDMNSIRSTPSMYTVNGGITFVIGFQIQDLEVLRVSDQA